MESESKADTLRTVLMDMDTEGIARFIEDNGLADKLLAQQHKPVQWK